MTTNHAYSALTPARCWASGAGAACSTAGNDIGASVVDHDDVVARGYGRAEGHHGAILPDLGPQHVPRIYGRADARAEFLESPRVVAARGAQNRAGSKAVRAHAV